MKHLVKLLLLPVLLVGVTVTSAEAATKRNLAWDLVNETDEAYFLADRQSYYRTELVSALDRLQRKSDYYLDSLLDGWYAPTEERNLVLQVESAFIQAQSAIYRSGVSFQVQDSLTQIGFIIDELKFKYGMAMYGGIYLSGGYNPYWYKRHCRYEYRPLFAQTVYVCGNGRIYTQRHVVRKYRKAHRRLRTRRTTRVVRGHRRGNQGRVGGQRGRGNQGRVGGQRGRNNNGRGGAVSGNRGNQRNRGGASTGPVRGNQGRVGGQRGRNNNGRGGAVSGNRGNQRNRGGGASTGPVRGNQGRVGGQRGRNNNDGAVRGNRGNQNQRGSVGRVNRNRGGGASAGPARGNRRNSTGAGPSTNPRRGRGGATGASPRKEKKNRGAGGQSRARNGRRSRGNS